MEYWNEHNHKTTYVICNLINIKVMYVRTYIKIHDSESRGLEEPAVRDE